MTVITAPFKGGIIEQQTEFHLLVYQQYPVHQCVWNKWPLINFKLNPSKTFVPEKMANLQVFRNHFQHTSWTTQPLQVQLSVNHASVHMMKWPLLMYGDFISYLRKSKFQDS